MPNCSRSDVYWAVIRRAASQTPAWVAQSPAGLALRAAAARTMGWPEAPRRTSMMGGGSPSPVPAMTATKAAVILSDTVHTGIADPGETIRYTVTIANGGTDATGVHIADTPDPDTTFVPGSIVVSPLALNDTYTSVGNMTLTSASIGADCVANTLHSVRCNDTGTSPTLSGFGATQAAANGTVANGVNTVTTTPAARCC